MKKAQGLVEYGLILAFVAIVAVLVLNMFSGNIGKMGKTASQNLNSTFDDSQDNYCKSIGKSGFDVETGECTDSF